MKKLVLILGFLVLGIDAQAQGTTEYMIVQFYDQFKPEMATSDGELTKLEKGKKQIFLAQMAQKVAEIQSEGYEVFDFQVTVSSSVTSAGQTFAEVTIYTFVFVKNRKKADT